MVKVIISCFVVIILIFGYLAITNWPDIEDNCCYQSRILASSTNEDGSYNVTIVKVRAKWNLDWFTYKLRKPDGLNLEHGSVSLHNFSGIWAGIDVTWDDNGSNDVVLGNNRSDRSVTAGGAYSDPEQAQIRINSVKQGYQHNISNQWSEGTISVSFHDLDLDGNLTAGDTFVIQGNTESHPANDEIRFILLYDVLTTEDISCIVLGSSKIC